MSGPATMIRNRPSGRPWICGGARPSGAVGEAYRHRLPEEAGKIAYMTRRTIDTKPGDVFDVNIPADGGDPTMTKETRPHDETWRADLEEGTEWSVANPEGRLLADPVSESEAKLIAHAPAMARLLLRIDRLADGEIERQLGADTLDEIRATLIAAGVLP